MIADDLRRKALELMARCSTCLVGSIDRKGYPAIRAMLPPRKMDGMKTLIFSTNTASNHTAEFAADPRGSVYYYDPNLFQGLLLRGSMRTTLDQSVRDGIWRAGDDLYYKLGPADPDYCALLFTAENGRWYENFSHIDFPI